MSDIATISLKVNTSELERGNQELNKFQATAAGAAQKADNLNSVFRAGAQSGKQQNQSLKEQQQELQNLLNRINPTNKAFEELDKIYAQLTQANKKGLLPTEQFRDYGAILDDTRNKLQRTHMTLTEEGRALLEQEASAKRAAQAGEAFVASLQEQASAVGKTRAEILEMKAAQLGVADQSAPFISKLREQEDAWRRGEISAGQYRNAMRQLPMQITDVVTSLASGMPVYMVAIQQGGQIRDSFGGVGNALKAVTSLITPARIAIGGLIGTLALMGAAAFKSSEQFDRAASSVLLMGGAGFKSLEQLNSVAARVASETGNSVSEVTDTLIDLNNQGKASGPEMERIAKAMLVMKDAGIDTKDSMADFGKILKDPIKGLAELNEKYGFLTEAEMKHLIQLKQTKGEQAAVTEAVSLYAGVMEERSNKVVEATDNIGRAWKTVKTTASNVFEQIGVTLRAWANQVIDIFELVKASINDLFLNITSLDAKFTGTIAGWAEKIPGGGALANFLGMDVAAMKKAGADADKEIEANKKRYDILWKRITAPNAQANYEAEARGSGVTGDGGTNRESRSAVSRLADESERKVRADRFSIDAATRMLQESRQRLAVLRQQSVQTESMTDGEKRLLAFNQQIADLKEKKLLTADEKSILTHKKEIRLSLEKEASLSRQIEHQKMMNDLMDSAQKLQRQQEAKRADIALLATGVSSRDAQRGMELDRIEKEYALNPKAQAKALSEMRKTYKAQDSLEQNWRAGAVNGLNEYLQTAQNVYSSVSQAAQTALGGISDMMTSLVTTGTASFRQFAASILKMIVEIINRLLVAWAVQKAMGWITGDVSTGNTPSGAYTNAASSGVSLFDSGGYTGDGGKYEPKGVVHGGEFVFTKEATSALGVGNLYALMRDAKGYADGGFVGRAPMYGLNSSSGSGGGSAPVINTVVNVDANGNATAQSSSSGDVMGRALADEMQNAAARVIQKHLKPGGMIYNFSKGR